MSETVKIKVRIETSVVGSECIDTLEIDRKVWDAMTEEQREETAREAAFGMIEWNWEIEQ